jgi:hypothetical protein
LEEFLIGDFDKKVKVESQLDPEVKEELVAFLQDDHDIFSWSHEHMSEIDLSVMVHKLKVDPSHRLVKQKQRGDIPKRSQVDLNES